MDELYAMRGLHDPMLRGTDLARYAEWDGTELAVREIVSTVAHYLEVGGTPWTPSNTRHWMVWAYFAFGRDLDVRVDADELTLAAYALAMLENGYAGKTVRGHLRSIVRMVYDVGPETRNSATAAALGCELTKAWARAGLEGHRRVAPVVPLGHVLALAAHLRDVGDVEGWWVVVSTYARALRPVEAFRIDPTSVQSSDDVVRAHVMRTKGNPASGEVLDLPRLREGWGDGETLDVGGAWSALDASHDGVVRSSVAVLERRLRTAAEVVGLREWTMRTPRRSRVTHMLLDGADVRTLMWMLRHESVSTTDRYIDALWAYGYDPVKSAEVLLSRDQPSGDGHAVVPSVRQSRPRALAAVAASEATTEMLRGSAADMVGKYRTEFRTHLSAAYVTRSWQKVEIARVWTCSNLGRDLDLAAPDADMMLAMWATAMLAGRTAYSSNPGTVEKVVLSVLLHAPPGRSFWRVKKVLSGALRGDETRPQQPVAATAVEVLARICEPSGSQAKAVVSAARTNVLLGMMWGSAGRIGDVAQVRRSTMFRVEGLGMVALLGTSKGGREVPCPRDVLLFPDRDDDLDVRRHLEVLFGLRAEHGAESDWVLARCDTPSAAPGSIRGLLSALARRSSDLGLAHIPSRAYRLGRTKDLAEGGATQPELQRWLRHGNGDLVSTYTRQADPGWLWRSAMRFVEEGL